MGVDKAFIEIDGAAMVQRAAAALRACDVREVVVVGGDAAAMASVGLPIVADRYPGQGPLGAVITALHALDARGGPGTDAVVTLPCDVIEPDCDAIRLVLACLADVSPATDAVVPVGEGVPQWLHAAWRRRCRPLLSAAFARGSRAPRDAAGLLNAVVLEIAGTAWFRDADRPEDLPAGARRGIG